MTMRAGGGRGFGALDLEITAIPKSCCSISSVGATVARQTHVRVSPRRTDATGTTGHGATNSTTLSALIDKGRPANVPSVASKPYGVLRPHDCQKSIEVRGAHA